VGENGENPHFLKVRSSTHPSTVGKPRSTSEDQVPLPSLLCSGAVHQALVKQKLRTKVGQHRGLQGSSMNH